VKNEEGILIILLTLLEIRKKEEAGMWSYVIDLLMKEKIIQHSKHTQRTQKGKQSQKRIAH